jgi:predicted phage terminase large subunit-like protein
MQLSKLDRWELARQKCRTDHFYLAKVLGFDRFFPDVHKPLFDLFIKKDHTKSMDELDAVKNLLILWPRGHQKTIAKVIDRIQWIINYPDVRILALSGKQDQVETIIKVTRQLFETPGNDFSRLFPEFCGTSLGNASGFTVPCRRGNFREPTVSCSTLSSVKTGYHYNIIEPDDLVNEKNIGTLDQIRKVISQFDDLTPLVAGEEGGFREVIGTRWHYDDLYGEIISRNVKERNWKISVKACWTKSQTGKLTLLYPVRPGVGKDKGKIVGFTLEKLQEIQRENPQKFAYQYLNCPIVGETQVFTDELMAAALSPDLPDLGPAVSFWDTASSTSRHSDESAGVTGALDANGHVWITDFVAGKLNPFELTQQIVLQTLKHRPSQVYIEGANGSSLLSPALDMVAKQQNINIPLQFTKTSKAGGAKDNRIVSLQAVLKAGRLHFWSGIPNLQETLLAFTRYPKGKHDDRPDVIALLYGILSNSAPPPRAIENPYVVKRRPSEYANGQQHRSQISYGLIG